MTMPTDTFLIIAVGCLITMVICRCVPMMVLQGKDLPQWLQNALNFIPPAAFAALIASDILSPTMFDAGLWPGLIPIIATFVVIPVAIKTKSLMWCIIVGVGVYAALLFI